MAVNNPEQFSHGERVPTSAEFEAERASWRAAIAHDEALRRQAVQLHVAAERHRYTYTWEWLGVPVIKLPEDIVLLQELFWQYRPERVIETGVARGGSMVLNATLMAMCGSNPRVLGIDHKIFGHTRDALSDHVAAKGVELLEADSTSPEAGAAVSQFVSGSQRVVLLLDSNHTHAHVLGELRLLAPLLPTGSFVLVADTIIEEFPPGHFADRPWDRGNNPLTGLRQFLSESDHYEMAPEWSRRGLLSEFRDGIIRRVGGD